MYGVVVNDISKKMSAPLTLRSLRGMPPLRGANDFDAEHLQTANWPPRLWRHLPGACHSVVVITPKSQMMLSRLFANEAQPSVHK
jgi:hypothetical protein